MKQFFYFIIIITLIIFSSGFAQSSPDGFVLIKGAQFQRGSGEQQNGELVRVDDFEILDHPVTNREYQAFIKATDYPPPLHWKNGQPPSGKENYPVIFVNRYDVDAYLKWLTQTDGRMYRLPTSVEFEYAARGGLSHQKYPWGNAQPEGKANFDALNNRRFDHWPDYLQPARWATPNGYNLFGMAGNVWQLVVDYPDPATSRYKYRIENLIDLEYGVMGGSWARSAAYLVCGYRLGASPAFCHPDIGFRPVRAPQNSVWGTQPRKLCAVSVGSGKNFLSWALLATDPAEIGFQIYRAQSRNHAGFLVNATPINQATCFIDSGLTSGKRYYYYVQPVTPAGQKYKKSEWAGVTVSADPSAIVTTFKPLYRQGSLVPIFGDLDGDGVLDCVIRLDNGNREMSQDPGVPVQLEAFTAYGRSLWRKDICFHDHCYGNANNVPFNVWDMNQDGQAEVITRLQVGDTVYVAILDGLSGEIKHKTPWPKMVSDFSKSSTRIHLSIAYLDGKPPAVITQSGLYENEVFVAFDAQLKPLWQFNSFAETSGSGGHKIEVADVNGDGSQEIFDGTTCLNSDGTLRWSIYKQHPDIVSIHDYLPERPGLEVFYIVESSVHAGVYLVDANSGEIIWKVNREDDPRWTHGHTGWTADIWDGSPGIECVSNRAGHDDHNLILFAARGQVLLQPFPFGYTPLEWDGDLTRELFKANAQPIGDFNGAIVEPSPVPQPKLPKNSRLLMVADLCGDFRDELVLLESEGEQRYISVLTATSPLNQRYITPTEKLDYRLWLGRNMGGGYRSIYDQALISPGKKID